MLINQQNQVNTDITFIADLQIDGFHIYLTNSNNDLTFNDNKYISAITNVKINSYDFLSGRENNSIEIVMNNEVLSSISFVNYGKITLSSLQNGNKTNIINGIITNIIMNNENNAIINFQSNSFYLKSEIGEFFSPSCRAEFGDEVCKIDVTNYTKYGKITEVLDNNTFLVELNSENENIIGGVFVCKTFRSKIYQYNENIITTFAPMLFEVEKNQEISIILPCGKTVSDCKKFNNIINFRGEPFIK